MINRKEESNQNNKRNHINHTAPIAPTGEVAHLIPAPLWSGAAAPMVWFTQFNIW